MLMVKHSSLKEETAKATEPITKARNKRYTKTRAKKSKTYEPVLPEPKWWQRNSICRLLCCQNICYSTISYIVLVIFLALLAYAVWNICNVYLVSKLHSPLRGSHDWKNLNHNNNNVSEITKVDHMESDGSKQNSVKKQSTISPSRNQTNILFKDKIGDLRNRAPSSSITSPSSSGSRQDLPGDKRYIIPPSPPRFKNFGGFDGSGGSAVEEWRAIRYNLLKNRLQLTTGSSYPTENPYWKAWFIARNSKSSNQLFPFSGSGVFPVHDDNYKNYKSISDVINAIPSVVVRNPAEKTLVSKHSDIQVAHRNTTVPNAYSKLLQDLFNKISATRSAHTTLGPTKSSKGLNATALQLKILSALINGDLIKKPSGPYVKNATEKLALKSPLATTTKLPTSKTTSTTKTGALTTANATATAAKATTTKGTTATTKETTTVTKDTTVSTATSKATTATTSTTATTRKASTSSIAASRHKSTQRNRRKTKRKKSRNSRKLRNKNHGSKTRHKSQHHHRRHHHPKSHTLEGGEHYKKSYVKQRESISLASSALESESDLDASGIHSGSGNGGGSGSGSGSGDSDSGSGEEGSRMERKEAGEYKKSKKSYQKMHKYVGLRERIKRLKHSRKNSKNLNKHNVHHGSNWRKTHNEVKGKARNFLRKGNSQHSKSRRKAHHHKKIRHERQHERKSNRKVKHSRKKGRKNNKHKFMRIIQRKLSRMKKKNQIAKRLKHVQNRMKEVMKRKHKKAKSHKSYKRDRIAKIERSKVKLLGKPIKRKEEPKHWQKGHLLLKSCVTLKEFDHSHYIGLTKVWKAGEKHTFVLTECKRKSKRSNNYKCHRTFYRTRGHMGLKSKRAEKRGKISLIVCRKESDLKRSLNHKLSGAKKASIVYLKGKRKRIKRKHRNHEKRVQRHKRRKHHDRGSSTKRHYISRRRKRKSHSHRHTATFRRHLKRSHLKHHGRKLRKEKRHKAVWSDVSDDDYSDNDEADNDDRDDDDDDDDYNDGSGSGSGDDYSVDEEERFQRSTTMSNINHLRNHGKNIHRRHHHNHHHNHHHHQGRHQHRQHRLDAEKKLSSLKRHANLTDDPGIQKYDNKSSQILTEFVDLMKEMKQEIQNVTVINANAHNKQLADPSTNVTTHPTIKMPTLKSNQSVQALTTSKTKPKPSDSSKNVSAGGRTSSIDSMMKPGMVQDMVAQIVPAIMKQFETKSIAMPTTSKGGQTTQAKTSKENVTASTTKTMTTKVATDAKLKTTNRPTTLKTTKPHPTSQNTTTKPMTTRPPKTHRPTTPRHISTTQRHSTRHKSQPHPKTTAAPNLALILKGLKALGITSLGQHTATGKPTQLVQKKSVTPSAPASPKAIIKIPAAPPKQPHLPPPMQKPLQLHNRFMMNILCFGDSLTAGYHNHGKAFTPYGNHLRQLLTYSSRIPVNLKIKGIVGEMTHKQMVSRLPEILGNNTAFDWVVILGGTNDILHVKNFADDQEFLGQLESVWQPRITKDIEKLHTIAHNYNAHTMLLTIPENAIEAWPGYRILLKMRTKINDALRQYANENRDKVALCDLAKRLPRHSLTPQQEAMFWDDHLHMTPQGYNRMAEEVFNCLRPYVPSNPKTI